MIKKMKGKKPEKIFVRVILNDTVVAKKEVKTSEDVFLSIMMRKKK